MRSCLRSGRRARRECERVHDSEPSQTRGAESADRPSGRSCLHAEGARQHREGARSSRSCCDPIRRSNRAAAVIVGYVERRDVDRARRVRACVVPRRIALDGRFRHVGELEAIDSIPARLDTVYVFGGPRGPFDVAKGASDRVSGD